MAINDIMIEINMPAISFVIGMVKYCCTITDAAKPSTAINIIFRIMLSFENLSSVNDLKKILEEPVIFLSVSAF